MKRWRKNFKKKSEANSTKCAHIGDSFRRSPSTISTYDPLDGRQDETGGQCVRHRALVVHLDHPRGYRNTEAMARNRAIRDDVAARRLAWAPVGLDRHLRGAAAASGGAT